MRLMRFLGYSLVFFLAACGDSEEGGPGSAGGEQSPGTDRHWAEMESSPPTESSLVTSAFTIHGTYSGAFIVFYEGGRYASGFIEKIGHRSYNVSATFGHFHLDGNRIVRRAERTSCPQMHSALENPPSLLVGDPNGQSLVYTQGSRTVLLRRYYSGSYGRQGLLVNWGCFDGMGAFSSHPWVGL